MSAGLLNGSTLSPRVLIDSNGVQGVVGTVATAVGGGLFSWNAPSSSLPPFLVVPTTSSTSWTQIGSTAQWQVSVFAVGVTALTSVVVASASGLTQSPITAAMPWVVSAIPGAGVVQLVVQAPSTSATALLTQFPGFVVTLSVLKL